MKTLLSQISQILPTYLLVGGFRFRISAPPLQQYVNKDLLAQDTKIFRAAACAFSVLDYCSFVTPRNSNYFRSSKTTRADTASFRDGACSSVPHTGYLKSIPTFSLITKPHSLTPHLLCYLPNPAFSRTAQPVFSREPFHEASISEPRTEAFSGDVSRLSRGPVGIAHGISSAPPSNVATLNALIVASLAACVARQPS